MVELICKNCYRVFTHPIFRDEKQAKRKGQVLCPLCLRMTKVEVRS